MTSGSGTGSTIGFGPKTRTLACESATRDAVDLAGAVAIGMTIGDLSVVAAGGGSTGIVIGIGNVMDSETGSAGVGATGAGSAGVGSAGVGSTGAGAAGAGATGVGATGVGAAGAGADFSGISGTVVTGPVRAFGAPLESTPDDSMTGVFTASGFSTTGLVSAASTVLTSALLEIECVFGGA